MRQPVSKRQPERQRRVAGAVRVEGGVGGRDLVGIEEDVALVFRPTAHALGTGCGRSCGRVRASDRNAVSVARARLASIGVRSAISPCQCLDGVAGDRPRLVLAEVREDVAVDQAAVAVRGARPPRELDDVAPLLDQVGNAPPRPGATVSPVSALSRMRLAWVRALPMVHAGNWPMVTRRCRAVLAPVEHEDLAAGRVDANGETGHLAVEDTGSMCRMV